MILLLNTSTGLCSLVLVNGDEQTSYEWQADRELAKGLLGFMIECLGEHQKTINDLSGIGVFRGPGSFTGLRIGLTVANTIAQSSGIPIVGETGDGWQTNALQRLENNENEKIILPLYDRPANITQPRK